MHADYKLSQTDLHEFAIHEKPGGALRATIRRGSDGTGWVTELHGDAPFSGADAAPLDEQKTAQAAFNAFIDRAAGPAPDADSDPDA